MALIFADSFDHYVTADIAKKWTSITNDPSIDAGLGRFSACLGTSGSNRYVQKTIAALGTYHFGFAFKFGAAPSADQGFFDTRESTTTHVDARLTATSLLRLTRAGTTLATGTTPLSTGTYYYIEIKVIVSDTVGLAELKLNGVLEIGYYGAGSAGAPTGDTRNGATGVIDNFRLGVVGTSNGTSPSFDDLVVLDTTGGSPTNTYLGDVRVEALFPSGNGNSSQWVGSDANSTDNYLLVDEAAQDGDTTYVESSTVSNKDTYAYTDLSPGTGTVFGVQAIPYARKTDAGTRSICSVARLSATETDSADKGLATTYLYYPDIREAKPGGGVWTITDVNSAEFGVKVTA